MDAFAARLTNRLACIVTTGLAVAIALSVLLSVALPSSPDLVSRPASDGGRVVTWLAPDGPAWSFGLRPGDQLLSMGSQAGADRGAVIAQSRSKGRLHALQAGAMVPSPLDVAVALLGLGVLFFGLTVLIRSASRAPAAAFWLVCVTLGAAMGFVPAGYHGVLWALPLDFIGLRFLGPAMLELALIFPRPSRGPRRHLLLWLPALGLVGLYAVAWWQPAPLFDCMRLADNFVLTAYLLVACAFMISPLLRPHSAQERAHLQVLAFGLVGGMAPFAIFTLLPIVLIGHALVPAQVTILATALLPLSIGAAIARTEFLGIPSLMRRQTLQVAAWVGLAICGAAGGGLLAVAGPQRWGWPLPFTVAALAGLSTLGGAVIWPRLRRSAGRLALPDHYDTVEVLESMGAELVSTEPEAIGPYVVARLSRVLNLRFALLLTKDDQWTHSHPRDPIPVVLQEAILRLARSRFAALSSMDVAMESVLGVPVLLLALSRRTETLAALCLGPKRAGERFTRQDQQLLHVLGPQLAVLLGREPMGIQSMPWAPLALPPADSHEATYPTGTLTRFELRVLALVAQGLANKEIAKYLGRETRTVEKHLTNIFRRLDARNRIEAVVIARKLDLLPAARRNGVKAARRPMAPHRPDGS